ncbi:hypothetical protein ACFPPD_12245 [Cohnella suwonensis]|uniref:Uncharacterized protein n=1 Tax=Cohnella suwonensis TaxID=696072 RepID=A0ABW0LUG4_9BACL
MINLHGINCPEWVSIGGDQRRFDDSGKPVDPSTADRAERVLATFVRLSSKVSA